MSDFEDGFTAMAEQFKIKLPNPSKRISNAQARAERSFKLFIYLFGFLAVLFIVGGVLVVWLLRKPAADTARNLTTEAGSVARAYVPVAQSGINANAEVTKAALPLVTKAAMAASTGGMSMALPI